MSKARAFLAGLIVAAVLHISPSSNAQEQVGSIEGVVRDQQGGVMPGTTVEAHSLAVGSTVAAVTNGAGVFRFSALPPGYYDVSATRSTAWERKGPRLRAFFLSRRADSNRGPLHYE